MDIDFGMVVAGAIVGFVIGLTGMGGGALMTPVLVLFFGVSPGAAVSSDVIASLVLKPIAGGVHVRRGTVNWRLVRWLMVGSIPTAFSGALLIDTFLGGDDSAATIKRLLGWVLLVAAAAIVVKRVVSRHDERPHEAMNPALVRPLPTVLIGAVGGLLVGLTSVGSGSLVIVMLMFAYPKLSTREIVGTDLIQAIPLVASAAVGHALFGDPRLSVIAPVLAGAIPTAWIGGHLSSRAADTYIRPALVVVLAVSALKLLDVPNDVLFAIIAVVLGIAAARVAPRAATRLAGPKDRSPVLGDRQSPEPAHG